MEFLNALIIEIALMPFGIELLNRYPYLIKWELERLTKEERETNQRSEPTIMLPLKTLGLSLREDLEALNTPSIKQQPMVWR
jgi:hypothetical protein